LPQTPLGKLTPAPYPLAVFQATYCKANEGEGKGRKYEKESRGMKKRGLYSGTFDPAVDEGRNKRARREALVGASRQFVLLL